MSKSLTVGIAHTTDRSSSWREGAVVALLETTYPRVVIALEESCSFVLFHVSGLDHESFGVGRVAMYGSEKRVSSRLTRARIQDSGRSMVVVAEILFILIADRYMTLLGGHVLCFS